MKSICPKALSFIGKSIGDTGILDTEGVTVVALRDRGKDDYLFNPSWNTVLNENNVIIVMGNIESINRMKRQSKTS